jgi:hypothetical protein
MALLKCTKCGKQFYGVDCPACGGVGQPAPKDSHLGVLGFLGVLALLVTIGSCHFLGSEPSPATTHATKPKLTLGPEQRDLLNKLESKGLLRLERRQANAYVDLALWVTMDAKLKEDFATTLAIECASSRDSDYYAIDIFDKQSARKLAELGPFAGFKVY